MNALLVIIDGCSLEALRHGEAPFLQELAKSGRVDELSACPGFVWRPALYAGLRPIADFSPYRFEFDRANSPWSLPPGGGVLRRVAALETILDQRVMNRARSNELKLGNLHSGSTLERENIPWSYLAYLAPGERKACDQPDAFPGRSTIFDDYRAAGYGWSYLGREVGATVRLAVEEHGTYRNAAVERGPTGLEAERALAALDAVLGRSIRSRLERGARVVVVGLGGIGVVTRQVAVRPVIEALGLREHRDFFMIIEPSTVRFWAKKPDSRQRISDIFGSLEGASVTEKDASAVSPTEADLTVRAPSGVVFTDAYYGIPRGGAWGIPDLHSPPEVTNGFVIRCGGKVPAGASVSAGRALVAAHEVFPIIREYLAP